MRVLVTLQKQVFEYLELLDGGKYTHAQLEEIIRFLQQTLCCRKPDIKDLEDADLVIYLRKKLNRPMRVCGMVKNGVNWEAARSWFIMRMVLFHCKFLEKFSD